MEEIFAQIHRFGPKAYNSERFDPSNTEFFQTELDLKIYIIYIYYRIQNALFLLQCIYSLWCFVSCE